jgi:drug/metabolite transporter (DMT)-like permease
MQNQNSSLTGYILIAISAVTFSAKGIFAKALYNYGLDPVTLLALRFAIALPFFWGLLFIYQSERVGKRDLNFNYIKWPCRLLFFCACGFLRASIHWCVAGEDNNLFISDNGSDTYSDFI